jgi:transposase
LFRDLIQTFKAKKLVVVDESSTHLHMCPRYARSLKGQRAYARQKRNYGQNISLLASLRLTGMGAAMVVPGGVNRYVFDAFVRHLLLPTLQPGDTLLLDNLPAHHASTVRAILRTKGCQVLFLPAYSPDLSPIEAAFAKIKQFLRTAKADTFETLLAAIDYALSQISPDDAIGFFTDCDFLNLD